VSLITDPAELRDLQRQLAEGMTLYIQANRKKHDDVRDQDQDYRAAVSPP
jgi:hypothetical protein